MSKIVCNSLVANVRPIGILADTAKSPLEYLDIIPLGDADTERASTYVFNAFCVGILASDGLAPPSAESIVTSHPNVIACPNVFPI